MLSVAASADGVVIDAIDATCPLGTAVDACGAPMVRAGLRTTLVDFHTRASRSMRSVMALGVAP